MCRAQLRRVANKDGDHAARSVAWRSIDFSFSLETLNPDYYGVKPDYNGGQRSELYRYELDMTTGACSTPVSNSIS